MSLTSKETGSGGGFEPVPEGTYVARCISVIDLGLQDSPWGPKEKVYIGFEVPEVRVEWTKDDEQHEGAALIGNLYTNSLSEKAHLRAHLQSWRGQAFTKEELAGFDLTNVLGAPCMISIVHNQTGEKVYANISGIMKLPKGTTCPAVENELMQYSDESSPSADFDKLPEWMQKKIESGRALLAAQSENPAPAELPPGQGQQHSDTDFDDDIPFN